MRRQRCEKGRKKKLYANKIWNDEHFIWKERKPKNLYIYQQKNKQIRLNISTYFNFLSSSVNYYGYCSTQFPLKLNNVFLFNYRPKSFAYDNRITCNRSDSTRTEHVCVLILSCFIYSYFGFSICHNPFHSSLSRLESVFEMHSIIRATHVTDCTEHMQTFYHSKRDE